MPVSYPTRCMVVDAEGNVIKEVVDTQGNGVQILAKTPEESKPHIGKKGLAELIPDGKYITVRITLDDGNIIYGHECWWVPLDENDNPITQRPRSVNRRGRSVS